MVKKRKAKSKNYFTSETDEAIILYNNTEDTEVKSKIYEQFIHYPFFKLTENIIHTFKFYYTEVDEIEHLQHEIITFLLSKMHLFNPDNGAKAYSYFGTIVKNWLIINNKKNYKKRLQQAPVEDLYRDETYSCTLEDDRVVDKLSHFIDNYIEYVENNFTTFFPKGNDVQVADAILELFRKREKIDIFNKKALYIYIREIMATNGVEVKTPKITKTANKLYDIFKDNYRFYLDQGYIQFKEV